MGLADFQIKEMLGDENSSEVLFTINGIVHKVSTELPSNTTLNSYIRDYAQLKGTKYMCLEGGCGTCIVSVTSTDPNTKVDRIYSVNTCLVSVFSCHGWAVTTVEGVGNRVTGYDKIQTRLAHLNGSQCGYCSPGFVMNMYSLLRNDAHITAKEVENSFGSNICRCTGYRPILDAFKSLTDDATPGLKQKCTDIEDLLKICPKSGIQCYGKCNGEKNVYGCVKKEDFPDYESKFVELAFASTTLQLQFKDGTKWFKVENVAEIYEIFYMLSDNEPYMLVSGNTGRGIYKEDPEVQNYIDISTVAELTSHYFEDNTLVVGANMTLVQTKTLLSAIAAERPGIFFYLQALADHIDLIAHVAVRNIGTLAGNLFLKKNHQEFPSDVFLLLETVDAQIKLDESYCSEEIMPLQMFMDTNMNKKVMKNVIFSPMDCRTYFVKTYKIMPRAQNALAIVNAGFCFKLDKQNQFKVLDKPSIVYGGITSQFIHATKTEQYLVNKNLLNPSTLTNAFKILKSEVNPSYHVPNASPQYREGLAGALLYRFLLYLSSEIANAKHRSGAEPLQRSLSSGKQDFQTNRSIWPLNQPMPKLEALCQTTGEAQYVNDIPVQPGELYGTLVITNRAAATIQSVDPSEALKLPGVVAFYSAKDIPGQNSFTPPQTFIPDNEELFCSGKVLYAGQPVGIILAKQQVLARKAARKVNIKYANKSKPLLTIKDVIQAKDESRINLQGSLEPTENKKVLNHWYLSHKPNKAAIYGCTAVSEVQNVATQGNNKYKVTGTLEMKGQYHYTMETLQCLAVPIEDGMDVYATTQWMQMVQEAITLALKIPAHRINVKVRRLGGAFGIKMTRGTMVMTACALAAFLINKPVRVVLDIETNMDAIGKRYPVYTQYEADVDDDGVIQHLMANIYEDTGISFNDPVIGVFTVPGFLNCYNSSTWSVKGYAVKTDNATTAYMRAPGNLEAIYCIEAIMEHIAHVVRRDPIAVRLSNMVLKDNPIPGLIDELKQSSDFDARKQEIKTFNSVNRWKKRGIALIPMKFPFIYFDNWYATVSIYRNDGTVAVSHGGIEMGQGLNTKVAQVVASVLGIPLDMVQVKPSNNLMSPNNATSGASAASESVAYSALKCCNELLSRLQPVRQKMDNPTWPALIQAAYAQFIDLSAKYMFSPIDHVEPYDIWGVGVTEVEIDVLTGQQQVRRVDLLEDAGRSLNPEVDVGQMEGAFVMGLGYFTTEDLKYDTSDGQLKTDRTLTYHPPGAKDIPIDFRVALLKNTPNKFGVLSSKAIGEPPICLSASVVFAIRNAISSARTDAGVNDEWFEFHPPCTTENIFLTGCTTFDHFTL